MSPAIAERVKCFRFVRDIPYYIAVSDKEQDYCCATKAPMLQKLLTALDLKSRRINCEFAWAEFGLPADVLAKATTPNCGHEYLEVFVPEKNSWVSVDPTWDAKLSSAGLPIADWDGISSTPLAIKPTKTYTVEESAQRNEQMEALPASAWQQFYDENQAFLIAINNWLAQVRHSETHAKTH